MVQSKLSGSKNGDFDNHIALQKPQLPKSKLTLDSAVNIHVVNVPQS